MKNEKGAETSGGLEKKVVRKKHPKQVFWEEEMKTSFESLVKDYDADLDAAGAIIRLIRYAIKEHWLPGYIKKERPSDGGTVTSGNAADLAKLSKGRS